ncbi:MAG: rhodanese-like domain-containing protein [Candidatus Coatesbacteria bacterium]
MASRFPPHSEVEARLWAVILVGCAGAAAGEIYNALSPRGVFAPVAVSNPATPAALPTFPPTRPSARPHQVKTTPVKPVEDATVRKPAGPPRVVDLAEVRSLVEKKAAAFVDARSALRFASGHIPGAVNIPSTDFEASFARLKAVLRPDWATVVYCESADCDESDLVLEQLVKRGYVKLLHFKAGWQVWEDAGLPQEQGAASP